MYKIKFNKYQKSVFKTVEFNGDKKRKIMSVYSYLIKYSDEKGTVTKSLTKLHKMYLRYHKKISLAYFKQISSILIDLELLKKIDNSLIVVSEKIAKKIADTEVTETVENTTPYKNVECKSFTPYKNVECTPYKFVECTLYKNVGQFYNHLIL